MNTDLRHRIANYLCEKVSDGNESTEAFYGCAEDIMIMCADETESILGPTSRHDVYGYHSELQDMSNKLGEQGELWDNLIL